MKMPYKNEDEFVMGQKIKIVLIIVMLLLAVSNGFAQKKAEDKGVVKSDTVKLPLSKLNIETLLAIQQRSTGLRDQIAPLQKQLNIVDSTWNTVLKTKLDAAGYDPDKGRWGIIGRDLVYIPNDTTKKK